MDNPEDSIIKKMERLMTFHQVPRITLDAVTGDVVKIETVWKSAGAEQAYCALSELLAICQRRRQQEGTHAG